MQNILIAFLIGLSAGIIDVIPMLIQKLDRRACLSAFVHYVVLGTIIPFVTWNIQPWLKGIIIAELSTLPFIIIVYKTDKKAPIAMMVSAAILGAGIALAGAKFIA